MLTKSYIKSIIHYEPDTGYIGVLCASTYTPPADITYKRGAMYLSIEGKVYSVRMLIWLYMTGEWHTGRLYTISGDPKETRWDWLTDNQSVAYRKTAKLSSRSTSGHTGITYNTRDAGWDVRIKVKGKRRYIGSYKNLDDAIAAKAHATMFL